MTRPSRHELADQPSLGEELTRRIHLKFTEFDGTPPRGVLDREHEESLSLAPTTMFDECPTAQVVKVTRPIPGEEERAAQMWSYFGGPLVKIYEANAQIQTVYRAVGSDILKRRIVRYPGEMEPQYSDGPEAVHRHAEQLLREALSLTALGDEGMTAVSRAQNLGTPIEQEEAQRLFEWLDASQIRP